MINIHKDASSIQAFVLFHLWMEYRSCNPSEQFHSGGGVDG